METVFEKAIKLANKLADEKNRQSYDPNCMNLALFADDDPNKPQVMDKEPKPDLGVVAPVPEFELKNERPMVRNINPIYPEVKTEEMPSPLPETPPAVRENSLNGYVKPVFLSRFSGPGVRKSNSKLNASIQNDNTETAAAGECCYYVQITHTKTYPAPGSLVLMRSCDHAYVWTNEQSEEEKPDFKVCPHCGKKTGFTQTEID